MKHESTSIPGLAPFHATRLCQFRFQQADGFSLIELMLAVSVVGVLAALAIPNYMEFIEKRRVAGAISELHGLAKGINGFALAVGPYPNSLADVGRSTMLDSWRTPYQYYRINCGTVEDTINLAKLKLRRKNSPRMIPANHPFSADSEWVVSLAVDNGQRQGYLHLAAAGRNGGGGGGPPCGGVGGARKDRFLVPINSDFDVYSMGKN